MPAKTLAQQRAEHSWKTVEDALRTLGSKFDDEFADHSQKLRMRVRASGLIQSLAFLRAKRHATELRDALATWCLRQGLTEGLPQRSPSDALLEKLIHGDSVLLRRATAESLAWLEWTVRFADARRKKD